MEHIHKCVSNCPPIQKSGNLFTFFPVGRDFLNEFSRVTSARTSGTGSAASPSSCSVSMGKPSNGWASQSRRIGAIRFRNSIMRRPSPLPAGSTRLAAKHWQAWRFRRNSPSGAIGTAGSATIPDMSRSESASSKACCWPDCPRDKTERTRDRMRGREPSRRT